MKNNKTKYEPLPNEIFEILLDKNMDKYDELYKKLADSDKEPNECDDREV